MTGYSLDSLLDSYSLDHVVMFYNYGLDWEEVKAVILVNKLIEAITGKKSKSKTDIPDKPDRAAFYKAYGDKIKTKKENK